MRWTFQSETSSSCSPTRTLPTLPEAASAVLEPRPCGACCFRFLTRSPSSHYDHCNTRANPDSIAGSIKRAEGSVWYLLVSVPQGCGYANRTSNLTDQIYLLLDYSVICCPAIGCPVWDLEIWSDIMLASAKCLLSAYLVHTTAVPPDFFCRWLLRQSMNVLVGGATDDCLLHLLQLLHLLHVLVLVVLQLTGQHDIYDMASCGEYVYCTAAAVLLSMLIGCCCCCWARLLAAAAAAAAAAAIVILPCCIVPGITTSR